MKREPTTREAFVSVGLRPSLLARLCAQGAFRYLLPLQASADGVKAVFWRAQ